MWSLSPPEVPGVVLPCQPCRCALCSSWTHISSLQSSTLCCCLLHDMCHGPNRVTSPTRAAVGDVTLRTFRAHEAILGFTIERSGPVRGTATSQTRGPVCQRAHEDRESSAMSLPCAPVLRFLRVSLEPWLKQVCCCQNENLPGKQAISFSQGCSQHYSHGSNLVEPPEGGKAKLAETNRLTWQKFSSSPRSMPLYHLIARVLPSSAGIQSTN